MTWKNFAENVEHIFGEGESMRVAEVRRKLVCVVVLEIRNYNTQDQSYMPFWSEI